MPPPPSVDAYIQALPEAQRPVAEAIRATILHAVPHAGQAIKYGMPAFLLGGAPFLYFAVWKAHVGVYPFYGAPPELEEKVAPYRDKKDTLRFELKRPIPHDVIELVARFKASRAAAPVAS